MVGVRGFEPPAPCSQGRCASQAALHPDEKEHTYTMVFPGVQALLSAAKLERNFRSSSKARPL